MVGGMKWAIQAAAICIVHKGVWVWYCRKCSIVQSLSTSIPLVRTFHVGQLFFTDNMTTGSRSSKISFVSLFHYAKFEHLSKMLSFRNEFIHLFLFYSLVLWFCNYLFVATLSLCSICIAWMLHPLLLPPFSPLLPLPPKKHLGRTCNINISRFQLAVLSKINAMINHGLRIFSAKNDSSERFWTEWWGCLYETFIINSSLITLLLINC